MLAAAALAAPTLGLGRELRPGSRVKTAMKTPSTECSGLGVCGIDCGRPKTENTGFFG
jgi:hypothetical protein